MSKHSLFLNNINKKDLDVLHNYYTYPYPVTSIKFRLDSVVIIAY